MVRNNSVRDRLGLALMVLAATLAILGWACLIGTALHTDGSDLHRPAQESLR